MARTRLPVVLTFGLVAVPSLVATVSCGKGVWGYATGTGVLLFKGLPGYTSKNLDPETRLERRTEGCMVTGLESLTQLPNNLALKWLSRRLGPMPGAYVGPYPTKEEAWRRVRDAQPSLPHGALDRESITLGGRVVELDDALSRRLGATFARTDGDLAVVELDGGTFILRGDRTDGGDSAMAVVDANGKRVVARWLVSDQERTRLDQ